ncbi:MAG: cysteine desulfurase-like protein [Gemmatimonadales bacterium]|nr:cysteine desulfurase-like protein [Gemmatimonadales bacterium]
MPETLTIAPPPPATADRIRRHFPALERTVQGRPVAYFDGPGGTQVPREVVQAMTDYLYLHNANTHWHYPSSEETDAMMAGARAALADLLGATPEEIAFGANMTTLTFHLARALGRGWGPGDEIVVTELDHHANVAPWQALQRERGVILRTVPLIPETGGLDWNMLEEALTPRTRLLAIGAASNALGTISDVARAAVLVHAAGGLCFVDAVHYAPHTLVDVRRLGCDFLACSAYKFYGPHVGVLYGRADLIRGLDVPKLAPAPESAPERLETGTLNHEGIAGTAAAVDFLASLAPGATRRQRLAATYVALHVRGQLLLERLWQGLAAVPGVRLYGPEPGSPRTPTVAFTVDGQSSEDAARALGREGLFVSSGDFYATTVVSRLGVGEGGLLRAGCACYTTEEEVDKLIAGVARINR